MTVLNKKYFTYILVILLLYFCSLSISYFISLTLLQGQSLTFKSPLPSQLLKNQSSTEVSLKTAACPLNGVLYTQEEAKLWENRRPMGIMVENHTEARPQWGLSLADVVYEAVAEGGITRFLSVFYCRDAEDIGPVRSARTYYIDWISEYGENPLYVHVGGAGVPGPADALGQLAQLGWRLYNDMDEISGASFPAIWRGPEKPAPHNAHTATKNLLDLAKKRGLTEKDLNGKKWDLTFKSWIFKDEAPIIDRPASSSASLSFWKGSIFDDYNVLWKYDRNNNSYLRFQGSKQESHKDALTEEQISAKVIVVQFMAESHANDGYQDNAHLLYATTGQGKALIFQDGRITQGQWQKPSRISRTQYFDKTGAEIKFNRGPIWIETLPVGADISYN